MGTETCTTCDEPLDDLECHHHSTSIEVDPRTDEEYTVCDDCPAWWPVRREA
jgi:hypothetical protein